MTNEFNPDWMCVCGDPTTLGIVHRKDGPCYYPDKREWVGLTTEEVEAYEDWEDFQVGCGRQTLFDMVRDIEAKLKEKNT